MICTDCTPGKLQCCHGFVDTLNADTVVAQLALLHQLVQGGEDFRHGVDGAGRAVQLQQLDGVCFEVLQAALDERAQVAVSVCHMRVQPPAGLGGDVKGVAPGVPCAGGPAGARCGHRRRRRPCRRSSRHGPAPDAGRPSTPSRRCHPRCRLWPTRRSRLQRRSSRCGRGDGKAWSVENAGNRAVNDSALMSPLQAASRPRRGALDCCTAPAPDVARGASHFIRRLQWDFSTTLLGAAHARPGAPGRRRSGLGGADCRPAGQWLAARRPARPIAAIAGGRPGRSGAKLDLYRCQPAHLWRPAQRRAWRVPVACSANSPSRPASRRSRQAISSASGCRRSWIS